MSHNPYQQYPGYPGTPPQGQGDYPASYPAPAPGYPQQQQGYYAGQQAPGYGAHPGQYQQHPGYEGINAPGYDYNYYDLYDNYGAYPGQDTAPNAVLAITSLIVGLLSLFLGIFYYVGIPLGIFAIVVGIVALNKIGKKTATGKGFAIGGMVTGGLALLVAAVTITITVFLHIQLENDCREAGTPDGNGHVTCELDDGSSMTVPAK